MESQPLAPGKSNKLFFNNTLVDQRVVYSSSKFLVWHDYHYHSENLNYKILVIYVYSMKNYAIENQHCEPMSRLRNSTLLLPLMLP